MTLTLQSWFCLKDERFSFVPQDPEDAHLIFCHDEVIENKIRNSIEMSFATNAPIKMLIHGSWGVGKTHLLYHIEWLLKKQEDDFPARAVMIEIGDITRKSRLDEVVRPFLDQLGLDFVIKLVSDFRGIEPNVVEALKGQGVCAHVAEGWGKFLLAAPGATPVDTVKAAFDYLKGKKPGPAAIGAGLSPQLLKSPELFDVLSALSVMFHRVHGRRLLFLADEAAKLEMVDADEGAQRHWINGNKLIFDDRNREFGFIYTISGRRKTLPKVLFDAQIQNRLGKHNVIELATLASQDVENYLRKSVAEFVDRPRVEALVESGEIDPATFDWDKYPFDAAGWTKFVEYFNRTQEDAKPRDISKALDDLAFHAAKSGKRLIDASTVAAKGY